MHLITILAFAMLFWRAEQPVAWLLLDRQEVLWTLIVALGQPLLFGSMAVLVARRAQGLLLQRPESPQTAQLFYHRCTLLLRTLILLGFAATVFLTPWPDWFAWGAVSPLLQIVGDLVVLSPFVLSMTALWLGAYPLERMFRERCVGWPITTRQAWPDPAGQVAEGNRDEPAEAVHREGKPWGVLTYLDFHLRHQFLVVAVPMALILFVADLARGYEQPIQSRTGRMWAPDALLGVAVAGVFVLAPLMLCRIWRTDPLEAGPLRRRLDALCRRIGLRCRDILVWHSDGMMINAAVMGLFAPVRYVLLSDALLETMDTRQIEAVFGHEAGHVRRRHIQHFLLFAFVGWLVVSGVMEALARATEHSGPSGAVSPLVIQGVGILTTILFWGLGFGWLSRRFEREADLFGAGCVTPPTEECTLPCSVHGDSPSPIADPDRVCSTGAAIFASALDRVAVLNGIPQEERSWRHSSIGSRIRFLTSLAADPNRVLRFRRLLRRVKIALLSVALIGSALALYYWAVVPEPAILKMSFGTR